MVLWGVWRRGDGGRREWRKGNWGKEEGNRKWGRGMEEGGGGLTVICEGFEEADILLARVDSV